MIKWIKKEWFRLLNKLKLKAAKREANRLHEATNKRYHVMKVGKDFKVVDNKVINIYNKAIKGKEAKPITINDLLKMSYYSTK